MTRLRDEIVSEFLTTGLSHHQLTLLCELLASRHYEPVASASDQKQKDRERSQRYRDHRKANGMSTYFRGDLFRADLMRRDGASCVYCATEPGVHVDHFVPVSKNGTDDLNNLGLTCRACNSGKGGRTPDEARMSFASQSASAAYQRYLTARKRADGARQVANEKADEFADEASPPLNLPSLLSLEKEETEEVRKKEVTRARRKTAVPLPDDWGAKEAHYAAAIRLGCPASFVDGKAEDLRIWARSGDERKVDWDQTFHGFLRRDAENWKAKHAKTGNVVDAADRLKSKLADFNRPAPEPGIRGGTNPADVRLLSKG